MRYIFPDPWMQIYVLFVWMALLQETLLSSHADISCTRHVTTLCVRARLGADALHAAARSRRRMWSSTSCEGVAL